MLQKIYCKKYHPKFIIKFYVSLILNQIYKIINQKKILKKKDNDIKSITEINRIESIV